MEKRRPIDGAEWVDRSGVCGANKFPKRRTGGQLACERRAIGFDRHPLIELGVADAGDELSVAVRPGAEKVGVEATLAGTLARLGAPACFSSGLGYYASQGDGILTRCRSCHPVTKKRVAHSSPARIDAVEPAWTDRAFQGAET
jgi:hypothetical protein